MAKLAALFIALLACALVACSGQPGSQVGASTVQSGAQSGPMVLPRIDDDLIVAASLPSKAIGEELPSEGLGSVHSTTWHATVGGFTQHQFSETLAFPPGTKITIRNLSHTTPHTFDVVKEISGPPAVFPRHPKLSFTASGGHLTVGYASGIIQPGHSVTVILDKGIYLVGCAFHYSLGMHDVLVVEDGAKPGPQATPSPGPTQSPTPTPTPSPSTSPSPGGSPTPTPSPTPYMSPTPTPTPTPTPLTITPSSVNVCINTTSCTAPAYPNTANVTVKLNGTLTNANVSGCNGYATVTNNSTGNYTITGEGTHNWPCYVYFTTNAGNQGSLYVYVWAT